MKLEETPNVADPLERPTISNWVKINKKIFFDDLYIIFRALWSWCHIFILIRDPEAY